MTELLALYELQELDLQIDDLKRTLAGIESQLADDSIVVEAKKRVSVLEAHAGELAHRRRRLDRAIEDQQTQLGRIQERLYSGAITSVKEMEAAEEERAATERDMAESEDRLLEVMVKAEEVNDALAQGRRVVERLESRRQLDVSTLMGKRQEVRDALSDLSPRRARVRSTIPGPVLHQYETLRSSRGGVALAKVERGLCSGCRMTLSTSEIQRVRLAAEPMQCGSCRRMLYLP